MASFEEEITLYEKKKTKKQGKKKRTFKKLKENPYWGDIDRRIRAGISPASIARWLQEDLNQFNDLKRETLTQYLKEYRLSLPPGEILEPKPLYIDKAIEKLQFGINELDELEKLYLLQLKRISIDFETEEKINKLFSGTNKEIALAKDLLKERMSLKMELGLVNRVPLNVNMNGTFMNVNTNDMLDSIPEDLKVKIGIATYKFLDSVVNRNKNEDKGTEVSNND